MTTSSRPRVEASFVTWSLSKTQLRVLGPMGASPVIDPEAEKAWTALAVEDRDRLLAAARDSFVGERLAHYRTGLPVQVGQPLSAALTLRHNPASIVIVNPAGLDGAIVYLPPTGDEPAKDAVVLERPTSDGITLSLTPRAMVVMQLIDIVAPTETATLQVVVRGAEPQQSLVLLTRREHGWSWASGDIEVPVDTVEALAGLCATLVHWPVAPSVA